MDRREPPRRAKQLAQSVEPYEVDKLAVLQRIGNAVPAAAANLPKLLASL
jgi:hypothetical protein